MNIIKQIYAVLVIGTVFYSTAPIHISSAQTAPQPDSEIIENQPVIEPAPEPTIQPVVPVELAEPSPTIQPIITPTPSPEPIPTPSPTIQPIITPTPSLPVELPEPSPTIQPVIPNDGDNGGGDNGGGGSGGSGGGGGGGWWGPSPSPTPSLSPSPSPEGEVLGAETICEPYLTTYIKLGNKNDVGEVKKLQEFLNTYEGEKLPVTGFYGNMTFAAINRFQLKYSNDILLPWVAYGLPNSKSATGYVYKTTRYKINAIVCPENQSPKPMLP